MFPHLVLHMQDYESTRMWNCLPQPRVEANMIYARLIPILSFGKLKCMCSLANMWGFLK